MVVYDVLRNLLDAHMLLETTEDLLKEIDRASPGLVAAICKALRETERGIQEASRLATSETAFHPKVADADGSSRN